MFSASPPDLVALSRDDLILLIVELRSLLSVLTARVSELERLLSDKGSGPPAFVRPNRPARTEGQKERKKRGRQFFRRLDEPTARVEHKPDACPDCGRRLSGGWVQGSRQVIEIAPAPVEITEHVLYARHCGVCGKRVVARPDLSDRVIGGHRIGIRLMSWIATLRIRHRVPVRGIQDMLMQQFGLNLSVGEIVKVLDTVAERGSPMKDDLVRRVKDSVYVHADETGWRQDGTNGYLWSFSTPDVRVYTRDGSRSGAVAEATLGANFDKILISDFYAGYNRFLCRRQRCWVHMLRDLHELKENEAGNADVLAWAEGVEDIYRRAKAYRQECRDAIREGREQLAHGRFERARRRCSVEDDLQRLASPHIRGRPGKDKPTCPQCVLAERCVRFVEEMFTFVEFPDVPTDNNAAERAIRPAVIARKVSGGTRSAKGSETFATLMSLFSTWQIRGLNPADECARMLASPAG